MDDMNLIFENLKEDQPEAMGRRELATILRRGGAVGSRTVEVVRVRSVGAVKTAPWRPTRKFGPRRGTRGLSSEGGR